MKPVRIFSALLIFLAGAPSRDLCLAPAPRSWKVRMTLEARGEYRAEAKGIRTDGNFKLAFEWGASLEPSDEDFLLVHDRCDLTAWDIVERTQGADSDVTLNANDFPDKPQLKVDYILKDKEMLAVSFAVVGFDIPKGGGDEVFYLVLPASAENTQKWGGVSYNAFVKAGSNKIGLEEKKIYDGPVEKTFAWTWKFQNWVQKQDHMVFQASGHEAKVKLVITPN